MQEIDDDDRQGQTPSLELSGNTEKLFLRLVAELALPESRGPVGELWRVARRVRVMLHDLGVGVPHSDIVV